MPDVALPDYVTGDTTNASGSAPEMSTALRLPGYVTGEGDTGSLPATPLPDTSGSSASDNLAQIVRAHRPALGDYLKQQGAPSGVGKVAEPDSDAWELLKSAGTAFGVPAAGMLERWRNWTSEHPSLSALSLLGTAVAHQIPGPGPELGPKAKAPTAQAPTFTSLVGEKGQQQSEDWLQKHPGAAGQAAWWLANVGVQALPMAAGAPAGLRAIATTRAPEEILGALATGYTGGQVAGGAMGWAGSYGQTPQQQQQAIEQGRTWGGVMGLLGGAAQRGTTPTERPPLPSYLTGEEPVPAGLHAPISPEAAIPPAQEPIVAPGASQAPVQGHVALDARYAGLGDETLGAMRQAVHQSLDRAAPGRAVLGEDGTVTVGANSEAHLHTTLAAAQEHLANHPVVATMPDGSEVHLPVQVTYSLGGTNATTLGESPHPADALAGRGVQPGAALRPGSPDALAGGPAPGAAAPGAGALPLGDTVPRQGLAEAALPHGGSPAEAAAAQAYLRGQAATGAPGVPPGAYGPEGALASGAEAAQAGRPGAEAAAAYAAHEAPPPAATTVRPLAHGWTLELNERGQRDYPGAGYGWWTLRDPNGTPAYRLYASTQGTEASGLNLVRVGSWPRHEDAVPWISGHSATDAPLPPYTGPPPGRATMLALARSVPQDLPGITKFSWDRVGTGAAYTHTGTGGRRSFDAREGAAPSESSPVPPPPAAHGPLSTGEAGFIKNPRAPKTPEQQLFRDSFPIRESFVTQEAADKYMAAVHAQDLAKRFPGDDLQEDMAYAFERQGFGNPRFADKSAADAMARIERNRPDLAGPLRDEFERQRIQSSLNLQMLRDLGRVPEKVPEIEDYLQHKWQPVKQPGVARDWWGSGSSADPITSILREREFPSLSAGVAAGRQLEGGRPNYARMVQGGDEDFAHTLALHRLMQDVSQVPAMQDGRPAFLRSETDPKGDPALGQGYKNVSNIPALARAIPGKGDLWMQQRLYDVVHPVLKEVHPGLLGQGLDTAMGLVKQLTLLSGTFHPFELTLENAAQRGLLAATKEFVTRGGGLPVINQLTRQMGWGDIPREQWIAAAKRGVAFQSPETDTNALQVQKTLGALFDASGLTATRPGAVAANAAKYVVGMPHDAMFTGYMAPLKVAADAINLDKLTRIRNGDEGVLRSLLPGGAGIGPLLRARGIRAMPYEEMVRGNTNMSNAAFGGQQWRLFESRFLSDPMTQKVFSRIFLAPDWFASAARLVSEPFSSNPATSALGINAALRAGFTLFTAANLANYALTKFHDGRGHFMVDNEPGKETEIQIGPNEFINFMKLPRELPEALVGKERLSNWAGAAMSHIPGLPAAREALGAEGPVGGPKQLKFDSPEWNDMWPGFSVLNAAARKLNPAISTAVALPSGHYPSGYPTDLTKARDSAQWRETQQLPHSSGYYQLMTALKPLIPINVQKLMQDQAPLTLGETAKQALIPFQISHGLSTYTAGPALADAYRRGYRAEADRIVSILRSHVTPEGPTTEEKIRKLQGFAWQKARQMPYPLSPTGKTPPEATPP
jgi:hypothetical protein